MGRNLALTSVAAMLCITVLIAIALLQGIDGLVLTTGIAAVIGLPTFAMGKIYGEKKARKNGH